VRSREEDGGEKLRQHLGAVKGESSTSLYVLEKVLYGGLRGGICTQSWGGRGMGFQRREERAYSEVLLPAEFLPKQQII